MPSNNNNNNNNNIGNSANYSSPSIANTLKEIAALSQPSDPNWRANRNNGTSKAAPIVISAVQINLTVGLFSKLFDQMDTQGVCK
jgi:hypothetical protein